MAADYLEAGIIVHAAVLWLTVPATRKFLMRTLVIIEATHLVALT